MCKSSCKIPCEIKFCHQNGGKHGAAGIDPEDMHTLKTLSTATNLCTAVKFGVAPGFFVMCLFP